MHAEQARELDSLKRIKQFVELRTTTPAGPTTDPHLGAALGELAAAIDEAGRHAAAQFGGRESAVQRTGDARALRDQLRRRYLLPLQRFARELAEDEQYRLELVRFRVPRSKARIATLLAAARDMLDGARAVEAGLTARGLPAGFLDGLAAALARLEQAIAEREAERTRAVEAKTGLAAALDRGWVAVRRMDLYVWAANPDDAQRLAAWREIRKSRTAARGRRSPATNGGPPVTASALRVDGGTQTDAQRPAA